MPDRANLELPHARAAHPEREADLPERSRLVVLEAEAERDDPGLSPREKGDGLSDRLSLEAGSPGRLGVGEVPSLLLGAVLARETERLAPRLAELPRHFAPHGKGEARRGEGGPWAARGVEASGGPQERKERGLDDRLRIRGPLAVPPGEVQGEADVVGGVDGHSAGVGATVGAAVAEGGVSVPNAKGRFMER